MNGSPRRVAARSTLSPTVAGSHCIVPASFAAATDMPGDGGFLRKQGAIARTTNGEKAVLSGCMR